MVRCVHILFAALLSIAGGLPPTLTAFAQQDADRAVLPGTYSFHSRDPFAAGADLMHLHVVLDGDGTAHIRQVSPAQDAAPFSVDGTWTATDDGVQIAPDAADDYTMHFADGFPTDLTNARAESGEPFGPLVFTLGSGDDNPLVSRLNAMLARSDHVDFRDPGVNAHRFGEYTRRAVVRFQSTHGLPPTGLVDLRTWQALRIAARSSSDTASVETTYAIARAQTPSHAGQPIYFTFDDGPNPTWTPRVLDVLARNHANGTFFMVGQEAQEYPALVRQVVQAGDYAADHTWDHETLEGVSQADFVESVDSTRDVIVSTASDLFTLDGDVLYVRPPYGATDESTRTYAASLGMKVVMWDVDPMDWREPGAQEIADYVLQNAQPGNIILMHDGGGDRSQTVAALETILPALAAQGYRFPTIFEGDPAAKPATTAPNPAASEWHIAGTGGAGANVRAAPSTTATVLTTLAEGTAVQPLDGPVEGDGLQWWEIRSPDGIDGWTVADLLEGPSPGSADLRVAVETPSTSVWVVAGTDGAGANLRARPSTHAEVVAELAEGTPVEPLEGPVSADGLWWRNVRAEGTEGWIVSTYVRMS